MIDVDVIIAAHDPSRAVDRAVSSVLDHTRANVRVTVVCHNIARSAFAGLLSPWLTDERLRFLDVSDGRKDPSGPFNAGLDAADAEFVSIMGSDDSLEPGAIDSWLAVARRTTSDAVLARIRHAHGGFILTPPTRPYRQRNLSGVKDRLAYRTAPLGLLRRTTVGELRFPAVADGRPGEDFPFTAALWFADTRISFDRGGPAYLVHDDAVERVTTRPRPMHHDTATLTLFLASDAARRLNQRARHALGVKALRQNVTSWIALRPLEHDWSAQDAQDVASAIEALVEFAPRALNEVSRLDAKVLTLCRSGDPNDVRAARRLVARRTTPSLDTILPAKLSRVFAREAPVRYLTATLLLR
ncbi:glycosyltransferase family A protein [Microbacterium sp. NC79]|uniref:glycosyltransferase family 2 protein n=1 Tax=Microbacterium sp. NC79 TaxID=2851009 RepID=UPI001C2B9DB8|nr:glycosyltransferase family A protein [Microbacterium sp. NC79]MBV0894316.1 glycosyltransferase family 2 protein [Microbacterium sp. NC79]